MLKYINPKQAHRQVTEHDALLVCAYEDAQKCQKYHLENALSLNEFRSQANTLSKDREVIFYCD